MSAQTIRVSPLKVNLMEILTAAHCFVGLISVEEELR